MGKTKTLSIIVLVLSLTVLAIGIIGTVSDKGTELKSSAVTSMVKQKVVKNEQNPIKQQGSIYCAYFMEDCYCDATANGEWIPADPVFCQGADNNY